MKKNVKKRVLYPFVGLATFIFAFVMFFVNSPNVYADTSYTYAVSDINFKTASADGYFTISKANGSHDGTTGKISYYMSANSSLSFTFTPTNKIITSVSTFNFYGEYDIDDYGTMAAKSVTYSYSFGSYTSESTTTTSEYTFSVDQEQLNAQKPGSIIFTITANEVLQLRVGGNFVFNAKDANVDVNFDAQGGSGGTSSIKATPGSAMPSITLPTKTGYTFDGYYTGTNGGGTKYYNANGTSANNCPSNGLTLYAKWTANQYTVTFNKQNGTGGSNSVTATYDSAMPSATMPTRTGYTFAGYYDNTSGGTQYYTATGESAKNWDKAAATTLYARWTFNPDELIGLINDIGDVNYPSSRESLVKAEEVYNVLEATDQTAFQTTYSNDYKTLTDARIEYDAQKAVKVQEVIDAINAIGEVTYPNTTVKEALLNAEELYDKLAPEEQNSTTITNYSTLTDARESYNTQRTSKVNEVIVAIDAISEPFDENRETQITNARTLFNALDLDEQNDTWVTNLADLTNAEAADIVADMIETLTPADTQEYRDAVSAARTAYTNLTDAQKSYISVSILQELVDNETAITVMDKINDIGNVQYTNASKALIDDANQAYEALTEDQKELVVNYSTLTQANTDYDKVDESVDKVNLIKYDSNGDLIFDDENKTLIDDAKETYDLLTDYQKEIYPEDILQKLLDALAVYNTLDKIDKIGDVSYTDGYINQVTDATNAYNDLTDSQKELISELALKDLNDNETVLDTLKQIHDIDNSTTPSEYKEKLDDAKTVYENLTDSQKTLIGDNIKDLNDREKTNEVVQNIDAIKDENSLEYSYSNKKTITDARKSYENLTADQ
ncbi:MAG: InlB B-repeat-containing protein, partial [Bacilli bacterium]|nr:InlB B-repeat-containing protein [Bacilli bacterium]